jgi:hypothetical protein
LNDGSFINIAFSHRPAFPRTLAFDCIRISMTAIVGAAPPVRFDRSEKTLNAL